MSWTWLEGPAFDEAFKGVAEDDREAEMDRREPLIQEIANRISYKKKSAEEARWAAEDDDRDHGPDDRDYDSPEEAALARQRRELDESIHQTKSEAEDELLEGKLAELGARMCRPYEAWNEDEQLMAYLERDRDGE